MRKHIFGFALFSFIVGVAVAVSGWLAFKSVSIHTFELRSDAPQTKQWDYCMKDRFKKSAYPNAKIEQAVLDVNTKQLTTFLSLNPRAETEEVSSAVALHFFVKNGRATRYLATENIWMNSAFDSEKESVLSSLEWLDNLESFDNLYVVPELNDNRVSYKKNPPRFDSANAAPVLLSKGKNF